MCIATLVSAKAAITEQIARDYNTAVDNVIYESDANADFLGVFVNGMNPKKADQRRQIYINTEVCGTYEITLALAGTIH